MPTPIQPSSSAEASATSVNGLRIQARSVGQRIHGAGNVLHDVSLDVAPGRLTVIAGSSGAGKTILLQTLAGLRAPTEGTVLHDGTQPGRPGPEFGFVPQEDIIHRELPLRRTLVYAAGLRMPPGTTPESVAAGVDRVLEALGLSSRAATPVRALAEDGTTVVLTTHTLADLLRGDQVVFLSSGGEVAYAGEPGPLCGAFGVGTVEEVYEAVAQGVRVERAAPPDDAHNADTPSPPVPVRRVGALRQWALLTRRGTALLLHNRLSVAVLAGSPVMIVAMFAVLFRAGAFDRAAPDPGSTAMIMFWIAFGAFFFGLTYGLLQICTELPVLRREWLAGLRIGPYVASKLTTMLPVLAVADVLLLVVLRALDRLPAAGWGTYGSLFVSSVLASAAALALGLLASAAVTEPGQATLMLPLLCFPQVLFSGAFVPVPRMTGAGEAISWAMTNRWAFEALGSGVGLESLWRTGASPLGPPLLDSYGDSFGHPASRGWLILAGFAVLFLAVTWAVLVRKCREGAVRSRAGR
ncbi:ABC transporter permease [Streptomyces mirabilis]|uniref:ABC transporter permease n=1 Tax=Streptomyces mirabilis TaxID=68239 RepID=UPI00368CA43A